MPLIEPPVPYAEFAQQAPGQFFDFGGQRVHYEQHGSGPPLLMLHGFASSSYSFREVVPRLTKRYRVIAPDLNGFGFTERPTSRDAYSPGGQLAVIEALLHELDAAGCPVLGHSYGGMLALLMGGSAAAGVSRPLVLISPVAEFGKPPWLLRSRIGRGAAYAAVRLLLSRPRTFHRVFSRAYHQKSVITEPVSEAARSRLLVQGMRDAFEGYGHGLRSAPSGGIALEAITARALVIAGRHDEIVPLADCQRIANQLPNATLEILERSGHSAPEEQPAETCAAIEAFLQTDQD